MPKCEDRVGWGYLVRIVVGVVFLFTGMTIMFRSSGGFFALGSLLIGASFIVSGAIFLSPILSQFLSSWAGGLFFPERPSTDPGPVFSAVDAHLAQGDFDQAILCLRQLSARYPQHLEIWKRLLHVTVVQQQRPQDGAGILADALQTITVPNQRMQLEVYLSLCLDLLEKDQPKEKAKLDLAWIYDDNLKGNEK